MLGKAHNRNGVEEEVTFKGTVEGVTLVYPNGDSRTFCRCTFSFLNSGIIITGYEWVGENNYKQNNILINDVKSGEDI